MRFQRQLSNGNWVNDDRINYFVDMVLARESWFAPRMKREPMTTRDEVLAYLSTGKTIHYDNDWYAEIRDADAIKPPSPRPSVEMVKCSCGHTIAKISVMGASLGTSCPDCYDRMSV